MKVSLPRGTKKNITSSKDVQRIMKAILQRQDKLRRQKEYFWTIGLSPKDDISYIELIAIGNYKSASADPVEIFHIAVSKKCRKIILVHNHPSGNKRPSENDIRLTRKLQTGGEALNIEIVDHIIITDGAAYYSFADNDDL